MDYDSGSPATPDAAAKARTLAGKYEALTPKREPFLQRARDCAALTVPFLMPPLGHSGSSILPTPFQSVGARGLDNLSSKLLMALFPPNIPFWNFTVEPYLLDKVSGAAPNARDEVEESLVKAQEAVQSNLEASSFRVDAHEALQHILCSGNACLYLPKGEQGRVFHLDEYVVQRVGGVPVLIILRELVACDQLPPDVCAELEASGALPEQQQENTAPRTDPFELYTGCEWDFDTKTWHVWQECCNIRISGTEGDYKEDKFPYVVLRATKISGEDYGRGFVERYYGDLKSLEGLTQAIVEGAAAAAKVLFLVKPGGSTDASEISSAPNGAFREGMADDVTVMQLQKFADFQIASNTANAAEQRLALAFLLNSAVQRQAERVTAEEIRFMAEELEQALSGLYSLLSKEFQLPVINLTTARMIADQKLPKLPKQIVRPTIVTGIEALGRGNDLARLQQAFTLASEILTPQVLSQYANADAIIARILTASGIRDDGLVKTSAEIAQEQAQAQQQAMLQKAAPSAVTQLGSYIRDRANGAQQGQPAPQAPQGQ